LGIGKLLRLLGAAFEVALRSCTPPTTIRIDFVPTYHHYLEFRFLLSVKMAAALLPRLSSPSLLSRVSFRQFTQKLFPSLSIAIPGVSLNLPTIDDIWESVLRAVPKNKVSHSKKRSRQLAGKALKDVNSLCRCPGCGEIKRTHRLCQTCLEGMISFSVFAREANNAVLTINTEMKRIWRQDYPNDQSV
jgi:ribosomal protein L32